jgi:hypothetical protein
VNLDRELADDQIRIIGVEFNIVTCVGQTHEMAMFVPNGTGLVLPRSRSAPFRPGGPYEFGDEYRPVITFHSTVGDHTIGRFDNGCPW